MCLITFKWSTSPARLELWANRDEFYARPSEPAALWPGDQIWAGRDLQAGGTWLALARGGRMAALTNIRDPREATGSRSRGDLVLGFMQSRLAPEDYLAGIDRAQFGGFNLLMLDRGRLVFADSRGQTQALNDGVYGLSNDSLNTPWPKTQAVMQAWQTDTVEQAMGNRQTYPDNQLPDTGVPLECERRLSAAFIESEDYGTRALTWVRYQGGKFEARETSFGPLTGRRVLTGF